MSARSVEGMRALAYPRVAAGEVAAPGVARAALPASGPMSPCRLSLWLASCLVLALAGCSSTPRTTADAGAPPEAVSSETDSFTPADGVSDRASDLGPESAADVAAANDAADTAADAASGGGRESRRDRRRNRRSAEEEAPEGVDSLAEVPERALAAYERALSAMSAENWTEAELELEELVLEFAGLTGPYVNLAIIYQRDGRTDEARSALDQALAIDPSHPAANNQLGILLREQGDFEGAEAAYRRAIDADPGYALADYNLGVLLDLYLGRQSEALELYETYQSLLPEPDQEVGRWIVDLRRRLGVTEDTERVAEEHAQ